MEQNAGDVLIVYSSKTGNTRKVAEGIFQGLFRRGFRGRIAPVEENPKPDAGEAVLLGFWVDRGTADAKALHYLEGLEGRGVGLFGTLGAYPDSDHARETARTVEALAARRNTCLGSFLCQGKIDPALTEQFKRLPADHPHGMNAERMKRHEDAAKHPDEADVAAAEAACTDMLRSYYKEET